MKKIFSAILAAMLVAGTMVLPTAAADSDIVYLQTFDDVASYDDLGWEIVESLTTNTSTYTIENGALKVDNLGGNDSYTVVVPADVMDEVNKGDYTVGYDFTLLESGDTARYLAMLINYDRELGNTYNSLHTRMKGWTDWQNRFVGTWSTNLDNNGGYQGLSTFNSKEESVSERVFGIPTDEAANVLAGKTIRYEMRVSNSGQYCETYMNGVLISGTDEAGWDQFTWASEDYSEICLKSGGSILGTVDNIVVVKGLGIPEGIIPAMGEAAAAPAADAAAPATTVATAPAVGELQNLALGAKVEVSGLETEGSNLGEAAVDGDMTTRWASEVEDEAYITLDLGTPIPVGYLEIYWETACAQDYIVETSSDGTSWTTVATVTGNTVGASPAGDAVIHEWTPATARFIRIATSKRNTEWGNSIWEIVARASKDAVVVETAGAYPASGTEVPEGSVIINGTRIGNKEGWGGNAAAGCDAAFDGDIATFFDPLGTGDGYCGIDAGEQMILTKIMIHPREANLPRFNGATIEGANEEDFSDAVALYISVEEASEFAWQDVSDEIEEADNTGYRYFRYINYTNHGDVAEVELYGYAVDGTNPGVVEAAPVEEAPAEEPAVEEPVVEEPAEEVVVEEPVVEEVVEEAPAEEVVEEVVEEAAQTFDFGVIAAVAAIVSAAGYALSKKR